jgi:TPR repeat protein
LTLRAAQGGYVPAQEIVGMMYAVGKGVQQDFKEAAKWFLSAAEAGNARAAANFVAMSRNLRGDVELGACPRNTPEELLFFAGVLKQDDQIMFHGQELSSLLSG